MILVISSPSNSTTGFLTWIFLKPDIFLICCDFELKEFTSGAAKVLVWVRRAARLSPEVCLEVVGVEAKHLVAKPHV
jgi:hypothetical protein